MTLSPFPHTAMVLGAGLGKRMRPLTEHMPKPLVPVAGIPLIDRVLDWLQAAGITRTVVNGHYMADMLEAHLALRHTPAISFSREALLLETGGGIRNALPLLGDAPFFSANSDTLCVDGPRPALHRLAQAWDDSRMDALLLLHPIGQAVGYEGKGDFFADGKGNLRRRGDAAQAPFVFTGVQLLHPRLFAQAPQGAFSMNLLYDRDRPADGTLYRVAGLVHDGSWLHVGDPEGLAKAERWLAHHA